ncbi:hypothetical protein [Neptunitalea lumnitzerae]|uniref:DUF4440 domain-containing protein n=1 Tax=Neptunitalea lumnitzerae TaxID=2965509 RepID=A0ABQ5MJ44_9FLAO|nr:hypothetical protein [Neptunitalea sp. Y10]GLB49429.1 hypothetical protein Y10_17970 [Neptunitalea sp. Y10]
MKVLEKEHLSDRNQIRTQLFITYQPDCPLNRGITQEVIMKKRKENSILNHQVKHEIKSIWMCIQSDKAISEMRGIRYQIMEGGQRVVAPFYYCHHWRKIQGHWRMMKLPSLLDDFQGIEL